MKRLHVLPVAQEQEPFSKERQIVSATYDPARPEVHRLLQERKLKRFDLRYASCSEVAKLMVAAFPRKNEYLERLLEKALERFDRAIRQPHGMVILTGPTGTGKSTTLVAAPHQVVTPEVNVLTREEIPSPVPEALFWCVRGCFCYLSWEGLPPRYGGWYSPV